MIEEKHLQWLAEAGADKRNNVLMRTAVTPVVEKILGGIENDKYKLEVGRVYVNEKNDNSDIRAQQQVAARQQVWSDDVKADMKLIDRVTGEVIDEVKGQKIAEIPKVTDRNTFLIRGNEYQTAYQPRLKPGVYTKTQSNGEISSYFNVDKTVDFERGFNNDFKIDFEPETKLFSMRYNGKKIPLYSALIAIGMTDAQLEKKWGKDVLDENKKSYGKYVDRDVRKLYSAVYGREPKKEEDVTSMATTIKARLFETKLNPDVTKITLGTPYTNVNGDAMLDASKKIISINRGDEDEDDRESMMFKKIVGIETHVGERLTKNGKQIATNINHKLLKTGKISQSMSTQMFKPYIEGVITGSQLSSPPNQTNIMSMIGESTKLTPMGEGGIGSTNAIVDSMRAISDTEAGFVDPLHTPEGGSIGITKHHSMGSVIVGGDIYGQFTEIKTGKDKILRPIDTYDKYVAFPDQYDESGKPKGAKVTAIYKGKITQVAPTQVDYRIRRAQNMFDSAVNSIPFLDSIQGNRGLTASKMQEQSVSLVNRDKPLFDIKMSNGTSISTMLGTQIATPKAPVDGVVTKITDEGIWIGDKEVQLYHNFSLNSESYLSNEPVVKVGDKVKKGQLLADNNFTKDGQVALGANLRVGWMPFKGYNYEDSTVVSESAAAKLTSQHIYDFKARRSSKGIFSGSKLKAYYPESVNATSLAKLDEDGVIKKGAVVEHGDVLIAHLEPSAPTADDLAVGRLDKQLKRDMSNSSQFWENGHKGTVTGVEKHGNNIVINIRTEEPLKVGDKVSGLHGNKHMVSAIMKDDEMPYDKNTGKRLDMTMSPIGVSNRINTSQIIEAGAGKVAEKTGKQFEIVNFEDVDNTRKVLKAMKDNGIDEKDILIDPSTGKEIKEPIYTGVSHILKLEHKIDHKFATRYREGHDSNEQPITGGHHGGKKIGRMEAGALLARGADSNLDEMFNVKSQKNDEYWRAIEMGMPAPAPKKNFVWNKFMAMSKGAGINIEQNGRNFAMRPLTDADIMKISAGRLDRPTETYRKKNLEPVNGGLFDPKIAGGMRGNRFTHFDLPEPVLNPATVKAASSILNMSQSDLEGIAEGSIFINKDGEQVKKGTAGAFSGGVAIKHVLGKIDVDKDLEAATAASKTTKNATELNKLNRKINYLKGLKKNNMKPEDYVVNKVLITPSETRPMFSMGQDGTVIIADENDLYQQVAQTAKALGEHVEAYKGMPEDVQHLLRAEGRGQLYKDLKALQGYSEPTAYLHRIKNKKGFMAQIDGGEKQTKEGYFQSRVLERRQDLTGRSTIILNPNLGGDELGIPQDMATDLFKPKIMAKMVEWGYTPLEAKKQIDQGTPVFKKARQLVSDESVVVANRAPSLHMWNMTSFKPVLIAGKSIEVPGHVVSKNFGGDFDGDTFQIHAPTSKKAVEEAMKFLPSQNMLKTGYGTVLNAPAMDMIAGTYLASKGQGGKDAPVKVGSVEELKSLIKSDKIEYSDMVTIGGRTDRAVLHVANSSVPTNLQKWNYLLNAKNVEAWIADVSQKSKSGMDLSNTLKDIGNKYITEHGLTLGLSDTKVDRKMRDQILDKAALIEKTEGSVAAYVWAKQKGQEELVKKFGDSTQVGIPISSGAGKGIGNTADIAFMPGILADANDNPIPVPVKRAYSEGLDTASYWIAAHGARGGNIKKSVQSSAPGYFTKKLVNSMYETRIANEAPVDDEGLEYDVTDRKAIWNRYLAKDVPGIAKRNDLINSDLISKLNQKGIKSVSVQSPLTDPTPGDGFSSWSYGVKDDGQRMKRGENVGIISAHSVTEPALNLAMKSFHTGGKLDSKSAKKKVNTGTAFNALDRVYAFAKTPPDKATLAKVSGTVESVKESSVGGFDVIIGGEKHYVSHSVDPVVKIGQKVYKGELISTGTANPHEMLELKGMKQTQLYLVNKISDINDGKLDKRNIEVMVRGITNTTKIKDPGNSDYTVGDIAPLTTIEYMNRNGSGIKHEPFLMPTGIGAKPSVSKDFISRLGHSRLKDVFLEGGPQGWDTTVSDTEGNPMTKLVTGVR